MIKICENWTTTIQLTELGKRSRGHAQFDSFPFPQETFFCLSVWFREKVESSSTFSCKINGKSYDNQSKQILSSQSNCRAIFARVTISRLKVKYVIIRQYNNGSLGLFVNIFFNVIFLNISKNVSIILSRKNEYLIKLIIFIIFFRQHINI